VTGMVGMFIGATAYSTPNYNLLLIGWSALTLQSGVTFNMNSTTKYFEGTPTTSRGVLTSAPNNWTITDGGQGVYVFSTKSELQTAVNLWISDNATALITYGPINTWNVSAITDMSQLFINKFTFNSDISNWDVSNVTNMTFMFYFTTAFDQPLNSWDVSSVNNMTFMFSDATSFNQDLSSWDVSSVTNMNQMFRDATIFNKDISTWDVSSVTDMAGMFNNTASFSTANYDLLLIGWSALTLQSNVIFTMNQTTKYSQGTATTARGVLTSSPNSWTVTDGGQV